MYDRNCIVVPPRTFVIAHRLLTIAEVDEVIVLDQGRINVRASEI
jgi:ABC-type transport system involved in Fe-S cluster assembly fused permease/ATPase subunit